MGFGAPIPLKSAFEPLFHYTLLKNRFVILDDKIHEVVTSVAIWIIPFGIQVFSVNTEIDIIMLLCQIFPKKIANKHTRNFNTLIQIAISVGRLLIFLDNTQ